MNESNIFNFDEAAVSQMENIRRIGLRRLRNRGEIDDFVQETLTRGIRQTRSAARRGEVRPMDRCHRAEPCGRMEPQRILPQ